MIEVMDSFHLTQTIQEPTRKENTLDLVFTNNTSLFTQIEVTKLACQITMSPRSQQ